MSAGGTHGLPEPIGTAVGRELARVGGSGPGAPLAELVGAWPAAVGEVVARNAWPARLGRDGVLLVHTSSSTWAFELTQLEATIRERLGSLAPRSLRFAPGPLPDPPDPPAAGSAHPPRPTPADRARADELARTIDSETLREAVARAAAASLARAAARPAPTGSSGRVQSG